MSIAVDQPALGIEEFSRIDADAMPDTALLLQDGLRYLQALWPVDDLMKLYLTDTAPERFELAPGAARIEVRGARGELHITRFDSAEFIFRKSILNRRPIGNAAEQALDVDSAFEPGQALVRLVTAGYVKAIVRAGSGENG